MRAIIDFLHISLDLNGLIDLGSSSLACMPFESQVAFSYFISANFCHPLSYIRPKHDFLIIVIVVLSISFQNAKNWITWL